MFEAVSQLAAEHAELEGRLADPRSTPTSRWPAGSGSGTPS